MMPPPLSSTAASQCTAALQGGFSRALFCLLFLSLLASFLPLSPSPSLSFCLCIFVSLSVCVRVWSVVVCGLVVRSAHRVRRESAKRKAPEHLAIRRRTGPGRHFDPTSHWPDKWPVAVCCKTTLTFPVLGLSERSVRSGAPRGP